MKATGDDTFGMRPEDEDDRQRTKGIELRKRLARRRAVADVLAVYHRGVRYRRSPFR